MKETMEKRKRQVKEREGKDAENYWEGYWNGYVDSQKHLFWWRIKIGICFMLMALALYFMVYMGIWMLAASQGHLF